jgi:uncharacterized protein (DUF433 family)
VEAKELGKYIVADPKICHGKPTFRGTRIMVWQILEMLARGDDWDTIIINWGGRINKEQIAEAITVASKALLAHESVSASEPELVNQ